MATEGVKDPASSWWELAEKLLSHRVEECDPGSCVLCQLLEALGGGG